MPCRSPPTSSSKSSTSSTSVKFTEQARTDAPGPDSRTRVSKDPQMVRDGTTPSAPPSPAPIPNHMGKKSLARQGVSNATRSTAFASAFLVCHSRRESASPTTMRMPAVPLLRRVGYFSGTAVATPARVNTPGVSGPLSLYAPVSVSPFTVPVNLPPTTGTSNTTGFTAEVTEHSTSAAPRSGSSTVHPQPAPDFVMCQVTCC